MPRLAPWARHAGTSTYSSARYKISLTIYIQHPALGRHPSPNSLSRPLPSPSRMHSSPVRSPPICSSPIHSSHVHSPSTAAALLTPSAAMAPPRYPLEVVGLALRPLGALSRIRQLHSLLRPPPATPFSLAPASLVPYASPLLPVDQCPSTERKSAMARRRR